ncbi:hypothetical protein V7S43_015581 [Phytophthora oleae]|uniref:RxLR effector protein n=1 Tax=Phytophthora oleae TaxID=2107226 RepID=A0ABD3EXP7_9STRA
MRLSLLLVAAAALVASSDAAPQSATSVTKLSTDVAPVRFLRGETKTQVEEGDSFDPEEEERVITFHGKLDKVDDVLKKLNLADDSVLKALIARGKGGVEQLITTEKGVEKLVITSKKTGRTRTFTNIDIENIRKIESTPAIKKQIATWKKLKLPPRAVSMDLTKKGIPKTKDNVIWEAFKLYSATSGRKFNSLSPTG